jgi:4-nitrophenyl phosphatase
MTLEAGGNVVCDLDGVLYLGEQALPGTLPALLELEAAGCRLLFCTNNSSPTTADVAAKLRRVVGYPAQATQVVSSAQAAASLLAGHSLPCYVLGGAGIVAELAGAGLTVTEDWKEAGAVVVGVSFELTYGKLRDAASAVRAGARFIATNLDATYPTSSGQWPGAGSIVAAVEVASGHKPEPAGKPYQPMRELIRSRLAPGPVWVVGDRVDTDLAMAAAEDGWLGALVLSGVTESADGLDPKPDLVAPDLASFAARVLGERRP